MTDVTQHACDSVAAFLIMLGAWQNWLAPISMTIGMIYFSLEIYESRTVQRFLRKRRTHE